MEKGLTEEEVLDRQKEFGKNVIITQKPPSPLFIFLSQFPSVINAILATAGVFSFILKDFIDGVFILTILILNALFGFIQEYRAEKSLEKLKKITTSTCRVIRNGKQIEIDTENLVVDDIVILEAGSKIPADGLIVSTNHIEIDESILTGESIPVEKQKNEQVFLGTLVANGKAYIRITKIGMETRFGKIADTLSKIEEEKTPLQKQLEELGKILALLAIIISLSLIPIGILQGRNIFPLILIAASIGIAAVPEGLPAVITIALSIGTNRMAKKNAIVRHMASIETLGAVQVILTDKTGTLTQNVMRVKKIWLTKDTNKELFLKGCVLGNTASLVKKDDSQQFDILGDKTDGALLLFAKQQNISLEDVKNKIEIKDEYVFDSITKTITTTYEENGNNFVLVRGAPEKILEKSKTTDAQKKEIIKIFENYAKEGLRVVGIAAKKEMHLVKDRNHLENNVDFLGIVGIYDPPRLEAKESVKKAILAGINVVMVTGDNPLTALSIAKDVGLIEKDEDVLTSDQLNKISDEQLEKILLKIKVFARTTPEDKQRLTNLFKKMGYIVGVTGDGINDTLALKQADVGIAMGESGTDVAKETSDIILTDDNFSTLVRAIHEGRKIYENILKSIMYLLSGNLAELSFVFFATLLNLPSPLLPTQILWINLVTDGIPALALASDNSNRDLLSFKPRDPQSPILTKNRILLMSAIGFSISLFLLVVFKITLDRSSETFARTVAFNLLIFLHLLIPFILRRGFYPINKLLIVGIVASFGIQAIITFTPFFQEIFHLGF